MLEVWKFEEMLSGQDDFGAVDNKIQKAYKLVTPEPQGIEQS